MYMYKKKCARISLCTVRRTCVSVRAASRRGKKNKILAAHGVNNL